MKARNRRRFVCPEGNGSKFYRLAKRLCDIAGAAFILLMISPIFLTVLVILTVTTGGRPFFLQRRVGYLGRLFPMIKFRTMRLDAEKIKHQIENQHQNGPIFKNRHDPRITRIGRWLRRTSLDETPQLINVLLGHMSLVGPRPPIPAEVEKYESWQRRRLSIMPGLTCVWQISGRSEIGFEEWVRMDIRYLKRQSLLTDISLLWKTPAAVFSGRGAY